MNCRNAVIVLVLLILAGCERPAGELRLITPAQELDRIIAEQIASLIAEDSGVRVRLVPLPDGQETALDALAAGFGDLAIAPNNERYRDSVNTIIPLYPSILHIAARGDSPPQSMRALLEDTNIFAGAIGSPSRSLVEEIASAVGIPSGDIRFANAEDPNLDVIVVYAPLDRRRISADSRLEGFRLLSLAEPETLGTGSPVDALQLLNPRMRPFIIPHDFYGKLTPDTVVTLAVDNLLVARSDLARETVFDVFAEVLRIRPALFGERPELFSALPEDLLRSNYAFMMHPGAVAFLQQDEPTFIERYSGVAEVLVTLMLGLVSGTFAVVKIYRIRRKNRIDQFYVDVIAIRDSVAASATDDECAAAIDSIRRLQNRAFDLLVDESLAADESFRIFVELTNNSIDDIKSVRNRTR